MKQKLFVLFFFILAFQSGLLAQKTKNDSICSPSETAHLNLPYNVPQFLHETYLVFRQPTQWGGIDFLKFGGVVGLTLAVMPFDERITATTRPPQNYYYSVPVVAGRVYGEWYFIGIITVGFGGYGLIADDYTAKKVAIELLQAGVYSQLVTTVLKVCVGRERPTDPTANNQTYHPFTLFDDNYHSFPSGHTTDAFSLSTVLSRNANSTFLKIAAYAPAALTMFSRIYQDKHWLSDEIPGAALGYFIGNWLADLHEGKCHPINVTSIYPIGISVKLP